MRHDEEDMQILCVKWFNLQFPKLAFRLHHSPNGGKRSKREAGRFKAMGVKAGFPDLMLFHGNAVHKGLAIEMKTDKGRQTDTQKMWQKILTEEGFRYDVCRSFENFRDIIRNYLNET